MAHDTARRNKHKDATRAECLARYEKLFGRPWDESLTEWSKRITEADQAAFDVLAKATAALEAARQFEERFPIPPIEERERREGLRVELRGDELLLFIDRDTLPSEAPAELRELAARREPIDKREATPTLLVQGLDFTYEAPPAVLRYSLAPTGRGSLALALAPVLEGLRKVQDTMARVSPALKGPLKRAPKWDARVAVLALFDRVYAPGELRARRSKRANPERLTDTEIAAISILCGNWPGAACYAPSEVIDLETRHVREARKTFEAYKSAGIPVPRYIVTK
jgi:hypothetical protein